MTINVTKYRLNPDRIFAGTRGSFGMEKLSFDFGDGWDFDTISVTFHPHRGNPIKVPLRPGVEINIPPEVMGHSGETPFVVSGTVIGGDGTVERKAVTLEGYVDVAYTLDDRGGNTRKVTPDMYDQLIDQASKIFDEAREDVERTVAEAAGFASYAEGFANSAEEDADSAEKSASAAETAEQAASKSAGEAKTAADTAAGAASNATRSADDATSAASAAKASATAAENSRKSVEQIAEGIPKTVQNALQEAKDSGEFDGEDGITPHIGENENWYIGNKDTGVRAKGKSGVHVGSDTPPAGTKVWVDPNGKRTKIPQIDETLAKPGYAADAKAVGEKINQLSGEIADLASITTKEDAEILRGICESSKYISADGTITLGGGAADKIETIEVAENTTVLIRASAGWGNCYYAFYDKNDTLIEKNNAPKDGAYQLQDYETLVPVGAVKIVVSQFGSTYEPSGITRYGGIVPNTGDLGEKVKSILNHFEESFLSVGTWKINNYIPADGIPKATQSPTYMVNSVPVKEGEKYIVTVCANWGGCLYSILDSDGNVLIKERSENVAALEHLDDLEIIIPKGAKTLALSSNVTYATRKCVKYDGYITTEVRLWHGKKWVVVGDSLTESNNATAKGYYDYIAEKTGITVVNMGLSGSGYARKADTSQAFYQRILNIPTDCDVVTIFGSFNDLGAGLELGNANDNGTETLAGCINTTIDNLYTVYPLANLGIVSPTPWDTTKPTTSGNAYDYVELLKEICELRSIPFLDLWRRSGLRPWEESYREIAYSKDNGSGTHPDETGHFVIAPKFKAFLEELLL